MHRRFSVQVLGAAALLLVLARPTPGQWVEDSIFVSGRAMGSMAYNSRAGVLYGACNTGLVFAIDCSTNQVVSSFNALSPLSVAYCSTENKAYCTAADTVLVIDGSSHTRLRSLYLEWATWCVWDGVSNRLYVTLDGEDEVAVLDCVTDSVIGRIRVGRGPVDLYLSTRHRKLYVLNNDSESISIVNLETNEVVATVRPGGMPLDGCYHAGADKFYAGITGGDIVAISGSGDTVCAEVNLPVGVAVRTMVVSGSELLLVGANAVSTDSVYALDVMADSIVGACNLPGGNATSMVRSQATGLVYVACHTGWVAVLPADGSGVMRQLMASDFPAVLLSVARHGRLYVGHSNARYVYVIRDEVGAIVGDGEPRVCSSLVARPNPFRTSVEVTFPEAAERPISIAAYSKNGRLVARLGGARTGVGPYSWDGRDQTGHPAPAGVYFLSLEGDPARSTRVVKLK